MGSTLILYRKDSVQSQIFRAPVKSDAVVSNANVHRLAAYSQPAHGP